jgi:Protein of unknown function (DUF2911)
VILFFRGYNRNPWGAEAVRTLIAVLVLVIVLVAPSSAQQDKTQRPSPPASASCKFDDGKTINTDYSSPRMKGRKIFGGLVPYGQVWRTGANEATTFVSDTDLSVSGKEIPAGRYTLFTLPAADKWTLIISKKTGEPGTPYPEGEDLLRVDMKVLQTQSAVENFTIAYHKKDAICSLTLSWERTHATVDLAEKKLCWPTTSPLTYSCPDQ